MNAKEFSIVLRYHNFFFVTIVPLQTKPIFTLIDFIRLKSLPFLYEQHVFFINSIIKLVGGSYIGN